MARMFRVGLTGNIGSGKTTAAQILADLGAKIIDADAIAHELLAPGSSVHARVVEAFGGKIARPDGSIDRSALGDVVFGDPEKRAILNRIVHPAVREEILRRIAGMEQKDPEGIVVVDAALLVESGFHRLLDCLLVVTCAAEKQLERIVRRNGLTVEQARARMASQLPAREKACIADYEIDNSGSIEDTRVQIVRIFASLQAGKVKSGGTGIPGRSS